MLHPDVQALLERKRSAVVFALQVEHTFAAAVPVFKPYSKFPSIRRDLAIVLEERTTADELEALRAPRQDPCFRTSSCSTYTVAKA